jgi:Kef-type K+ transport system membrane component KefB
MGKYFNNASSKLFPPYEEIIISLSKFGYVLFAFLAGVRMDPTLIGKTGRTAFILGFMSSVTAFIIMESTGFLFPKGLKTGGSKNAKVMFARIYMACMIQTQFVGVSFILMQLKMINSQLGHIALASSLVNELLRLAFGFMSGFLFTFNVSERAGVQTIIFSLIFVVLILTLMKRLMFVVVRITPEGQPVKEIYATVTVATVFLISTWGDSIGLNYLAGPLILGLVLPARSPLAEILIAKFDTIVSGFLLPLMAMLYASKVDLWQIMKEFDSLLIFKISLIGFTMKVVATFFLAKFCKIPTRHAVALALILNAKGINELGTLGSYSTFRVYDDSFSLIITFY